MNTNDQILTQLTALENQFHNYEVRSNHAKLSKLLAPAFYEFASSGKILSREDILSRLPTVDDKTRIESHSFKLSLQTSEISLLTYISKKINPDGSSLQYLRSSLWKNYQGIWQMEFHQGTIKN
jgi:hypothetical protein